MQFVMMACLVVPDWRNAKIDLACSHREAMQGMVADAVELLCSVASLKTIHFSTGNQCTSHSGR